MKFSIEKKDIANKIAHLVTVVPSKNAMAILTTFLLEADQDKETVTISASDMEITVTAKIKANVLESGKTAIPAKYFSDIIAALPNSTIYIQQNESKLKINCGNSKFSTPIIEDFSVFPIIPKIDFEKAIEFEMDMFTRMISNTSFAVSNRINSPVLNGIFWQLSPQGQIMVATDASKIAEVTIKENLSVTDELSKIMPVKTTLFISKILDEKSNKIKVLFEENRIVFNYENFTIFSHVIEGEFPDYKRAFQVENDNVLVLNRSDISDAIKRVSLASSDIDFRVLLSIKEDGITLSSSNDEKGFGSEDLQAVEIKSEAMDITLNYKYLLSILNVITSENVKICLKSSTEAILIYNQEQVDENFSSRFLLMPLRVRG